MAERRRGLGRGLGALIPSTPPAAAADAPGTTTPERGTSEGGRAPSGATAGATPPSAAPTVRGGTSPAATPAKSRDEIRSSASNGAPSPQDGGAERGVPAERTGTKEQPKHGRTTSATGSGGRRTVSPAARQKAMKSRMDMGEALRNTTLVSRPSDMFFLPSTSASGQETESSPASAVSRETAEPAGTEDSAASSNAAALSTPEERSSKRTDRAADGSSSAARDRPAQSMGKNGTDPTGGKAENSAPADTEPTPEATPDRVSRETDAAAAEDTPTLDIPAPTVTPASAGKVGAPLAGVSRETDTAASTGPAADPDAADGPDTADEPELVDVAGARFAEIRVVDIHPNRKQPRQVFDEEELAELAYSIGELGVLQPIVVRRSREAGESPYELVMGERRWRATQRAGLETIPAIVRETADDALLRDALLENLHRSQLNPLEEAAAYQQLMEEFGATQEELSRRIGRSRPQISNTIRLLRLPPLVQRRVAAGVLSSGHARALLALSDPAEMERLAQRIVAEGLSVRATEEAVALLDGGKRSTKRSPASTSRHQERLDYIADAFSDRLDTAVKIALGARKGRMTIEFASVEDLNRIIEVLDPGIERD